jgi:putative methyltransferase (TIGR04325 family)
MQLKDFLPPIVVNTARRLVSNPSSPLPEHRNQVFESYESAAAQCVGFGYEASELVDIVCRKTIHYRDQLRMKRPAQLSGGDTLALVGISLAHRCSQQTINVLDFGGACGAHYFLLKSILMDRVSLNWHVVETPAMAKRAAELETDELRFFSSIDDAASALDRVDLAFSSGTLQCIPSPMEALRMLLQPRPEIVVLARLGLTQGSAKVVTIHEARLSHNGPGPLPPGCIDSITRYPFTFPPQSEIESILSEKYQLLLTAPDPTGVFPVNNEPLVGIGYVGRIRDHAVGKRK